MIFEAQLVSVKIQLFMLESSSLMLSVVMPWIIQSGCVEHGYDHSSEASFLVMICVL